ncbi:MAG: hypothetical protein H6671_16785 [Anaerolineaceae bacterium]|nr:hypothetical protein [Anaerolineaceae bacterium]
MTDNQSLTTEIQQLTTDHSCQTTTLAAIAAIAAKFSNAAKNHQKWTGLRRNKPIETPGNQQLSGNLPPDTTRLQHKPSP